MPQYNRGFTLIELLVVIILISIFFTLAVVSIGGSDRGDVVEEESRRFKTLIALAKEKALFENVDIGLFFYQTGYGFVTPVRISDPQDSSKQIKIYPNLADELDDKTFRIRTLPEDIRLTVLVDDVEVALPQEWPEENDKRIAQAMLFSSGESNRISVEVNFDDEVKQSISINEIGKTTVSELTYND